MKDNKRLKCVYLLVENYWDLDSLPYTVTTLKPFPFSRRKTLFATTRRNAVCIRFWPSFRLVASPELVLEARPPSVVEPKEESDDEEGERILLQTHEVSNGKYTHLCCTRGVELSLSAGKRSQFLQGFKIPGVNLTGAPFANSFLLFFNFRTI